MKKVLVTGGGGFIGKAIVHALLKKGFDVGVVGRNRYPDLEAIGVEGHQGDIRDLDFLRLACRGKDTVFHVAAKAGIWGKRKDYFSINAQGTENIVDACRHAGVHALVYTSTPSVVFDRSPIEGGSEQLPYASQPLCHYAASKIVAEKTVLAADGPRLRTIAMRPHLVWGPGDRHLIPRILERGRQGSLAIVGNGHNQVDISYIDNVVHAHLLGAENLHQSGSAGGEAFFIGQEVPVNLWQWINGLFAKVGIDPVDKKIPFTTAYMAGWLLEVVYRAAGITREPKMTRFLAHQLAHSHWFTHEKLAALLGYSEQVSTAEGMQRLVAWIEEG